MANNNKANRSNPRTCSICKAQLKNATRLRNHIAKVHRWMGMRVATQPKTNSFTGQIQQADQNLPTPARSIRTLRGSRVIPRGVANRIDRLLTPTGADFVHRSCHPNDDSRAGGVFIPDDTTADRAILESRPYGILQYPGSAVDKTWDLMLAVLPLTDVPFVWRWRDVNGTWSNWKVPVSDAFVIPGTLYGAQQPAQDAELNAFVQPRWKRTPSLLNDATQFRQAFKGLTAIMNCASLTDQGFVTAGQWGNKPTELSLTPFTTEWDYTKDPNNKYPEGFDNPAYKKLDALVFNEIPTDMSGIVSACPEYGQWEAKKGIYMPMRFDDPVHTFNGGSENTAINYVSEVVNTEIKVGHPILMVDNVGEDVSATDFLKWAVKNDDGREADGFITSAGHVNQTLGIMLFSGIHTTSQIIVKCRAGLDLVPAPKSAFAAMSKKGPLKDQVALDMATSIQAQLPVVYEHKFNSLSMIVPWIAKAAMKVFPLIAPWAAKQVTNGLDWLGTKVARAFDATMRI